MPVDAAAATRDVSRSAMSCRAAYFRREREDGEAVEEERSKEMRIRTAFGAWVAAMGAVACLLGGSAVAQSLDAPTIASVSVKTGTPGTQLTIVGTSFNGATVTFTQRRVGATPITVP